MVEIQRKLLRERALLRQWGKKNGWVGVGGGGREGSCWSEHCCGSEGIQIALLREQLLLGQWGNTGSAPEGSSHYSGSDEIQIALLLEQSLLRRGEIQKRLLRE